MQIVQIYSFDHAFSQNDFILLLVSLFRSLHSVLLFSWKISYLPLNFNEIGWVWNCKCVFKHVINRSYVLLMLLLLLLGISTPPTMTGRSIRIVHSLQTHHINGVMHSNLLDLCFYNFWIKYIWVLQQFNSDSIIFPTEFPLHLYSYWSMCVKKNYWKHITIRMLMDIQCVLPKFIWLCRFPTMWTFRKLEYKKVHRMLLLTNVFGLLYSVKFLGNFWELYEFGWWWFHLGTFDAVNINNKKQKTPDHLVLVISSFNCWNFIALLCRFLICEMCMI